MKITGIEIDGVRHALDIDLPSAVRIESLSELSQSFPAGTVLELAGGTHQGMVEIASPGVTLQNAPGEVAVIDSATAWTPKSHACVRVTASDVTLRSHPDGGHFVLKNSAPERRISDRDQQRPGGFWIAPSCDNVQVINVLTIDVGGNSHNLSNGGGAFGCLFFGTGWDCDDVGRGRGHAYYPQGRVGVGGKRMLGCVVSTGYSHGFHGYGGEDKAQLLECSESFFVHPSAASEIEANKPAILFSSDRGEVKQNACAVNFVWQLSEGDTSAERPALRIGSGESVEGFELLGNYFVGSVAFGSEVAELECENNEFRGAYRPGGERPVPVYSQAWERSEVRERFEAFKQDYPDNVYAWELLDSVAPFSQVWYSPDEEGRAHVAVSNPGGDSSVNVSLNVPPGAYEVYNAERPSTILAGESLMTFNVGDNGATVDFPMTTKGEADTPIGATIQPGQVSGARCGVFLVRKAPG